LRRILKAVFAAWLIQNVIVGIMLYVSSDFRMFVASAFVAFFTNTQLAARVFAIYLAELGTVIFIAMVNIIGYEAVMAIRNFFLIVAGLVALAVLWLLSEAGGSVGGGTGGGRGGSPSEDKKDKAFPLFEASRIVKAEFFDHKILRDSSWKEIGTIEKAAFSNDQIVRDSTGKEVGRISGSGDVQTIRDADGKDIGRIITDGFGKRTITEADFLGRIGTFEKTFLGDTSIRKERDD